jgi:hypothetical protein
MSTPCVFTLYAQKSSEVFFVTQQVLDNLGNVVFEETQGTADLQQEPNENALGAGSVLTIKCTRVTQQGNILGEWRYYFMIPANTVKDNAGNYLPEGTLATNLGLENTRDYNNNPPTYLTQEIQTPLVVSGSQSEYIPPGQTSVTNDLAIMGWESTNGYFYARGIADKTKDTTDYRAFTFSLELQQ